MKIVKRNEPDTGRTIFPDRRVKRQRSKKIGGSALMVCDETVFALGTPVSAIRLAEFIK